ncbi:hypothetical protein GMDG_08411 [Pseudogymnoascus destructans 20631-21]|uniref:Uncharacterized protein n=1 Tax=Pseudogymnoascus destructans (strain ATCC MYA-4855 / 20631-21) TaxID=658429 RepID=L8G2S8_PSED2|nr:hypothetical protein GMDG_08411 [Pseudogymnoascus destructans 20631-21]
MYRSMTGVYVTLAAQPLKTRMHPANVFVITLGLHGSNLDDVLLSILDLPKLDRGMSLNINGEKKLVMAFMLGYIRDMPQQNDNAGILRQNAAKGCRSCLASKEERGDIHFDYMRLGRYHHHQVQL